MGHGVRPVIFYYNPNIWPREEYEIRKAESKRHAEQLGISWVDGDYDHGEWRMDVCGLEQEPERGKRCELCFTLRLTATARKAREMGISYFATTLASSRWKRLEQITRAGEAAERAVPYTRFWAQNWRKDGLQERRNELLKEYGFYNQQYCGCEFSAKGAEALTKALLREEMREAKRRHAEQLETWSAEIVERLAKRLAPSAETAPQTILAYWPLPDEVDIRPLIRRLVEGGNTVLLPRVTGETTMELRRYTTLDDLHEGAFHIMEPTGEVFGNEEQIDVALVPGMAFDAAGRRLGRGRGYYDRLLAAHPGMYKIGICFPFQRVAEVPVDEHDIAMDE